MTHVPAQPDSCPAEVTTLVKDPLRDEILLELKGAVTLPTGTVIELPGGEIARVAAVRLIAVDKTQPQLIIHVVRSQRSARPRP